MTTQHQTTMNTRTSLFALAALAAVATTALVPTSASAAWGPGGVYGRTPGNNSGGGFGGKPNGAVMHPGPCVPGATNCGAGGGASSPGFPNGGQAGHPGGWPQGGQAGHPGGWPQGGQAGHPGGWPQGGDGGHPGGWPQGGQAGHPGGWNQGGYRPGDNYGSGRWGSGWRPSYYANNGYWRRPTSYWYGSTTYATAPVQTYATAPVQTYVAPPVQTYVAPPVQSYATAPAYVAPARPVVSNDCSCLSKSYLPDGTVVFADNCSKETATAAPGGAPKGQAVYQPR